MSTGQEFRKKRLETAMKQNILRRKGEEIDDVIILQKKVDNFIKPIDTKIVNKKSDYSEVIKTIIDLFAGGLTGLLIGFGIMKIFNIDSAVPMIVAFAFGIMGGFYNIVKNI
jgi:F0F1-type ATP synthase assembly protein I